MFPTLSRLPGIDVLAPPPEPDDNYNCFLHAFNLHQYPSVLRDCKGFLYSPFTEKLISEGELEIIGPPRIGDIVLYRNPRYYQGYTHAGRLLHDGCVLSKWSWGPLLKHKTLHVPSSYGSKLSYVKGISAPHARKLYEQYRSFNTKRRRQSR